ncbi:MAG: ACT domain-containing protein, partial [Gallionellaceae bacterium]
QDEKGNFQLSIIAGDRPGLLARIAHVLTHHHIVIRSAKINTLGARAEDTFWISGDALNQAQAIADLSSELKKSLL